MDDIDLARRCADRDDAAWEVFMVRHADGIHTAVRKTLARYSGAYADETVEDIFSEVVVSLLENGGRRLRQFDGRNGCRLSTFIHLVSANTAISHLRKNSRHKPARTRDDETVPEQPDWRDGPYDAIARRETDETVSRLLEGLSADDRLFVKLMFQEELPADRVAALMGITPNAVYSRKFRLMEKLRNILRKESSREASNR